MQVNVGEDLRLNSVPITYMEIPFQRLIDIKLFNNALILPSKLEKRQKVKDIQKLVAKKLEEAELEGVEIDSSSVEVVHPELWNRSSRNYTFNSSKEASKKITRCGASPVFGALLCHAPVLAAIFNEQLLREEIRQQLSDVLTSINLSQPQIMVQPTKQEPRRPSTKSSCVALDPLGEDTHTNIPYQINEEASYLVDTRKVYKLGSTMHHQTFDEYHIRVVVEHIRDVDGRVPMPINKDFNGSKKKVIVDLIQRLRKVVSKIVGNLTQLEFDAKIIGRNSTILLYLPEALYIFYTIVVDTYNYVVLSVFKQYVIKQLRFKNTYNKDLVMKRKGFIGNCLFFAHKTMLLHSLDKKIHKILDNLINTLGVMNVVCNDNAISFLEEEIDDIKRR
ncbi:hypothetical protein CR513_56716, partial [Mucuna pruriens]